MIEFDVFLDQALVDGKGRQADGTRRIPAFVPSGPTQDALLETSIGLLRKTFTLFDVRGPDGYSRALNAFALSWHVYSSEAPSTEESYALDVAPSESRLLIVCGSESFPRFWKNLHESSALHTGASYPPLLTPRDKCITVPDAACVCVLVSENNFSNLPSNCLGSIHQYESETRSWLG